MFPLQASPEQTSAIVCAHIAVDAFHAIGIHIEGMNLRRDKGQRHFGVRRSQDAGAQLAGQGASQLPKAHGALRFQVQGITFAQYLGHPIEQPQGARGKVCLDLPG